MAKIRLKLSDQLLRISTMLSIVVSSAIPHEGLAQYGLYGFGAQSNGRLGNGNNSGNLTPSTVPIHNDASLRFLDLSGAQNHTLAIKEDGSLWAWGSNNNNQLGDPAFATTAILTTPHLVDNGKGSKGKWARVFAVGISSSFAITENGDLWAWGDNTNNRLGLPGTPAAKIDRPTQVMPGSKWRMVSGGDDDGCFTIGIQADSSLWVWGANSSTSAQLGTGNNTVQAVPFAILPTAKWNMVTSGHKYSLAIKADGSLWGWGNKWTDLAGAFGDTTLSGGNYNTPKLLDAGTGIHGKWTLVSSRNLHTQAIREDGSLWGWGQNTSGRIGDGTTDHPLGRKIIDDGKNGKWSNVIAGLQWSVGIKENNIMYLWGEPIAASSPYNSRTLQVVTEAGTLTNGKIFAGRMHGYWINDYPIICPRTTNLTVDQITNRGADISWHAVNGTLGYEIAIDMSATAAPAGSSQSITDTTFSTATLNSGMLYYAHIRSFCAVGSYSAWDTISFTTRPCLPPLNLGAGQIATNGGIISWDSVAGADGYEIVVDQTANPVPSGTPVPLTDTFYNATLTPGNTWYAHVRTNCGGGNYSDWDTISFSTPPVCPKASGFKAEDITASSAKISWDAVTLATEYDIAIDTFATLAPGGTASTQTATDFNPTQLDEGQKYYVHLRSHCSNSNYSEWDTLSFATPETESVGSLQHPDAISVYPNPASQTLYISSAVLLDAHIYNVHGQKVKSVNQTTKVDIARLDAGIYMIKLTNGEGVHVKTTRFVKQSR
jgi:alpha-tubulin suppressor-like RCC1 family protein